MRTNVSTRLYSKAKKEGFTKDDAMTMVMADLMALGYGEKDAFVIAYSPSATFSKKMLDVRIKAIIESESFIEYLDKAIERLTPKKSENVKEYTKEDFVKEFKPLNKDEVLMKYQYALQNPDSFTKMELDILKEIANIQRMKDDQTISDESTVITYLPAKCFHCEGYSVRKKARESIKD